MYIFGENYYPKTHKMKVKDSKKQSGTDWERLSTMEDSKIDLSDNPELDHNFFDNATLRKPPQQPTHSVQ
jgi:hypothetical protein